MLLERTYVDRPGYGILAFLVIAAVVLAAGINALIVFSESAEWTEALQKPPFALTGLQIGLVWEALFASMAVCYWFIRGTPPLPDRRAASIAFGALLAAILAFPFYAILPQNLLNAFVGTLGSAFLAWVATVVVFRNSRKAGVMLLPVPVYLSFASVVAYHVFRLNPDPGLLG
jgi:tryptophan-rich sensory protein